MKKALALLVILPTLALAQIPIPGGGSGGSGGSGTVSGTTGLPACFTGDTVVGNCTIGEGLLAAGGTASVDPAVVPRFYTGAGAPSAANTAGRDIYQDTTNIRFYRGIGGTSWIETQRVSSGSGAPAAGACDAAAEAGYLYYRTDNTSGMSPLYSCGQTGAGTYGWLLTLAGTRSGNTTEFATVSGTKTVSKQLAFDASGNVIASASDIGGGSAVRYYDMPAGHRNIVSGSNITFWGSTAAAGDTQTLGTNPSVHIAMGLADAAANSVAHYLQLPPDWTPGTVDVDVFWSANDASTNSVQFEVSIACIAVGEAFTTPSYNTASTSAAANGGNAVINKTTFTSVAITNCAQGERMWVKVARDGANAADTLAVTARFHGAGVRLN